MNTPNSQIKPSPTVHLRFVSKIFTVPTETPGISSVRVRQVLQQFWYHPDGNETSGSHEDALVGFWIDVPSLSTDTAMRTL